MTTHKRLREFLLEFLDNSSWHTVHDIYSHIYSYKWCPSKRQISAVLVADSRFESDPNGIAIDYLGYTYPVCKWRLKHG